MRANSHEARLKQPLNRGRQKLPNQRKASGAGNLGLLQSADLKRVPWLIHGFSTRPGGLSTSYGGRTLNLGFTKDDERAHVERNRKDFSLRHGRCDEK